VKQKEQIRWDGESRAREEKELLKEIATRRCKVECSRDVNEIEKRWIPYCEVYKMSTRITAYLLVA